MFTKAPIHDSLGQDYAALVGAAIQATSTAVSTGLSYGASVQARRAAEAAAAGASERTAMITRTLPWLIIPVALVALVALTR